MTTGIDLNGLMQQATALFRDGRLAEALAAADDARRRAPARADLHAFGGMLALRLGDPEGAAARYREAVRLRPDYAEAHFNLGNALKQLDAHVDAAAAYSRVIDLRPDLAPAWHNLGNVYLAMDDAADAIAAFHRVLAIDPSNPDTHRNLGIALQKDGALDAAIEAYRGALGVRPGWPAAASNLVQALLVEGDASAAVAVCDEWLAHNPGHVEGMALKCVALNEAGADEARDALLDFDRFVVERTIEAPPGYDGLDDFNDALADYVLAHPTLKVPPRDDPTYHHPKLQVTDEILGAKGGPMAVLEEIIRDRVADYWRRMGDDPAHPFLAHRPRRWDLSAWSVVLRGEGNLVSHIHLDGYLGGAYYVKMPDEVRDPDARAGWFELGRPPDEVTCRAAPVVRAIQPLPGTMLQFPGYFYHRTTPYQSPSGSIRITIAFDVVPAD